MWQGSTSMVLKDPQRGGPSHTPRERCFSLHLLPPHSPPAGQLPQGAAGMSASPFHGQEGQSRTQTCGLPGVPSRLQQGKALLSCALFFASMRQAPLLLHTHGGQNTSLLLQENQLCIDQDVRCKGKRWGEKHEQKSLNFLHEAHIC